MDEIEVIENTFLTTHPSPYLVETHNYIAN